MLGNRARQFHIPTAKGMRSMIPTKFQCCLLGIFLVAGAADLHAQKPPYDVFPPADPPYYRVRYEASTKQRRIVYPVNYTIWIPKDVKSLRGVIVHQHGCGEGSCKSGLTGAYDLHWQALAKKHDCALLAPSYEQPEKADCQMWCDPRNGSECRVSEVPRRSRGEVGTSRVGQGAVGVCGDTAAAVTGPAAWCCCIRTASPPPGCVRACRC